MISTPTCRAPLRNCVKQPELYSWNTVLQPWNSMFYTYRFQHPPVEPSLRNCVKQLELYNWNTVFQPRNSMFYI